MNFNLTFLLEKLYTLGFKIFTPNGFEYSSSQIKEYMSNTNFTFSASFSLVIILFLINKLFINKSSKLLNILISIFLTIASVTKIYLSYDQIYKFNQDMVVWVVSAIRMEKLKTFEYLASWDNKGSAIHWMYYSIYKFINFSENIWTNFVIVIILWSLLIVLFSFLFINKQSNNRALSVCVSSLLLLNLLFTPGGYGYPSFDPRFIGSSFIFFAIFNYLNRQYILGSTLLAFTILFLPTFLITIAPIVFYTIISLPIIQRKKIFEIVSPFFVVITFYIFYLIHTEQLFEYYDLVINFNFNLLGIGSTYPIIFVIQNNFYLLVFFVINIIGFSSLNKKFDKYFNLIFIWSTFSVIHLVITGPRFLQYDQLLTIPLSLMGFYSYYFINQKINDIKKVKSYLKIILFLSLIIPINLLSQSISTSLELNRFDYDEQNRSLLDYYHETIPTLNKQNLEFGIVFTNGHEWQSIMSKYNVVPSSRAWHIIWHKRDFGWMKEYNFDGIASNIKLNEILYSDYNLENPEIAIIQKDYKNSYNNYLYDYVLNNFTLQNCNSVVCIYKNNIYLNDE